MRYCIKCEMPMYTSNYSIWIDGVNYLCHKKCLKLIKSNGGKNDKEI